MSRIEIHMKMFYFEISKCGDNVLATKVHLDWNDDIKSISNKRKLDSMKPISRNRKRPKAIVAICSRIGSRLKSMKLSLLNIDWKDDEFTSIGRL